VHPLQPRQWPRDAGAGTSHRGAWQARERTLGQRSGVHFSTHDRLGGRLESRAGDIQPGRPMQNGHVESFHGRLRDECLNATWFRTLNDVRCTLATWREEYNCERPHSSLDYRTPQEFRQQLAMQMWKAKNASHIRTPRRRRDHLDAKTKLGNSSNQWVRDRGQVSTT
jgi:transposase InsO family protein